jgi:hypothetical protein
MNNFLTQMRAARCFRSSQSARVHAPILLSARPLRVAIFFCPPAVARLAAAFSSGPLPRAPRAADAPSPHSPPPGAAAPPSAQSLASSSAESTAPRRGGLIGWAIEKKNAAKLMVVSYGWLFSAVYFGVYLVTLGGIYGVVASGLINPPDVNEWINNWSLKGALFGPKRVELPPWAFEFATAWIITKTTEPARLMASLALVPILVKRAPLPVLRLFVPPSRWPGVLAQRAPDKIWS